MGNVTANEILVTFGSSEAENDSARPAPILATPGDIALLTARMSKGDEAAFREFYDRYFNRLLHYLFVLTSGQEELARETLQLTLIRVARHVRHFDSEEVFWRWLTVLARSAVTDEQRKRGRYRSFLDRFFFSFQTQPGHDPAPPEATLHSLLETCLRDAESADRDLIERKYFDGQSVRDIAATYGTTEKTIESRLTRIRRKLKEALQTQLKHEDQPRI